MNSPHVFLAFTQGKRRINRTFSDIRKRTVNPGFICYSPFSNSVGNAWKMQRSRSRENYRETFRKISYSLSFSWCCITCDIRRVFLEFTEGEQ